MGTISLLVWPFDGSGEMQHACARWWCRMVAVTIGARIHVHGVEQVQAGRSYAYVANHSSLIDTPALFAYLPYEFKIRAKRSLFCVPFMVSAGYRYDVVALEDVRVLCPATDVAKSGSGALYRRP